MQTDWRENLVFYQFSLDLFALHPQSTYHRQSASHRVVLEDQSHLLHASVQSFLNLPLPMAHHSLFLLIWVSSSSVLRFLLHQFRNQILLVAC